MRIKPRRRLVRVVYILIIAILFPIQLSAQKITRDMPKKGEGVYQFLLRNGRSKEYYAEFIKMNKKHLNKDNSLKLGFYYKIPPKKKDEVSPKSPTTTAATTTTTPTNQTSNSPRASNIIGKTVTEPLFGPVNQTFKIESEELKDACFYVVSGHGGPDPGAIGKMGIHHLHEHEYAYDIALRLARELMIKGATVRIIIQDPNDGIRDDRILKNSKRATCMGQKIPLSQLSRLKQRTDKINELYATDKKNFKYCRAIFLHLDSRVKKQQIDVFFYHYGVNPKGAQLAETMRKVFASKYNEHQPNRGFTGTVSTRNLYVIKNSYPVALFAELGNIQNEFDQRRFVMSSNRQALAKWMCLGFIEDYKNQTKK